MSDDALDMAALARLESLGGPVLLRRMIAAYLETGSARVSAMADAAAAGDAERIEREAHSMKTSAANLGASRVRQLAETLEQTAATGSIDMAVIDDMSREYESSAAALRRIAEERA